MAKADSLPAAKLAMTCPFLIPRFDESPSPS
jgi:hypothetical protein